MVGPKANATTPVADYAFQNSLASSVGSAPDLTVVGSGTSFATETVNGQSQTVFTFPAGSGLSLNPTTSIFTSPGVYTIRLLARHDEVTTYEKYIDFLDRAVDVGLYDNSGYLRLYPEGAGLDLKIDTGYVDVVMTRDVSGTARGYINGVLQFTDDDSVNAAAVVSNANTLFFFLDDVGTGTEVAPGAVARITIWDAVLSEQEIASLEPDLIFADEFDEGGP
jgi:hypothetical protein